MHKFHVRFTGANDFATADVTFKLEARTYAEAEELGWVLATQYVNAIPGSPVISIQAIHIGTCEAGCL